MDERAKTLRSMQICRFCLDEKGPFTNIYEKDSRDGRMATPLPLQIMACVAIEVFPNDGMPQLICNNCRSQTIGAYNFKTTCKKSDDALKLFLATGNLIKQSTNNRPARIMSVRQPIQKDDHQAKRQKIEEKPQQQTQVQQILQQQRQLQAQQEVQQRIEEGSNETDDSQEDTQDDASDEDYEDEPVNAVLKVPQVETNVYPCSECERSFPLKQLLDLHMKNHNRERSFPCDECGRKFFTKYDLAKHTQTHTANKPYSCVICTKTFSRESLLHRHEKIHVNAPKYLCSQCERTFLTREDLDVHAERHKKKRPFTCRICNKGFVFKQGLERHEATHSEDKPHKCNYCEASFTSPIKLMRHITSHAGLRPYPCKVCGRTFLLSHHLTRHMRSHYANKLAGIEPVGQHKCDVCSMSFRRKDSLINHSAIHSMVNLKCVICNTSFMNAKQVKDHITTHLTGLPYPCDKCDYSFETQDQLEEHELKHAEMEYEELIEKEISQEEHGKDDLSFETIDDQDDEDDDIAEFTITNDCDNNPQIVRRTKRAHKIKNYAQFLKDELGSDVEDEILTEEQQSEDVVKEESEPIKPIIRSEGTKVYTRKTEKNKMLPAMKNMVRKIDDNPSINLDTLNLTEQIVQNLPNKRFVDMKIGDKTLRVQKLMMTKAEIEAMTREGKIERKGETLILKKQSNRPVKDQITIENILTNPVKSSPPKPLITKTYVRKPTAAPQVPVRVVSPAVSVAESISEIHDEPQDMIDIPGVE